jgi:hypothetical protein
MIKGELGCGMPANVGERLQQLHQTGFKTGQPINLFTIVQFANFVHSKITGSRNTCVIEN